MSAMISGFLNARKVTVSGNMISQRNVTTSSVTLDKKKSDCDECFLFENFLCTKNVYKQILPTFTGESLIRKALQQIM